MAQGRLTNLPAETVGCISEYLESLDLLSLRSACRALADKTSGPFQDRFFRTRYIMLERQSLQNLVEISRHPVLRYAVQVVELTTDHLVAPPDYMSRADYEMCGINDEYDCIRLGDGETLSLGDDSYEAVIERYRAEWGGYRDFLLTKGGWIRDLVEALSNLPRCKAVGIDDNVRPWGALQLGRRIGTFPNRFVTPFQAQSMVFATTLIRALFIGLLHSRHAVERLYLQFGDLKTGCTSVTPRMLSTIPVSADTLRNRLAPIKTLLLVVNPNSHENTFDKGVKKLVSNTDPIQTADSDWCPEFCGFLRLFPTLTNLALHFNPRDERQQFPRLSEDLRIPGLRSLRVEFVDCTRDELMILLEGHRDTLRELTLESVDITGGGRKTWSSLLRSLQRSLRLEAIDLGDCMVDGFYLRSRSSTTFLNQRFYANGPEEIEAMRLSLDRLEESEAFPWLRRSHDE
ncbi:hypothetical protein CGGC5_v004739 [Colletotrichum fructicola Nara gc5]|uniref:F-box domain-containing protein n=1 Tax=Colletotrichum fructicola (strain Nara gc5) TaxID=1213859 RepID=L2FQW2_COLFN|nr:hypothetical protein CGGC5_v004739 [Colletotrichum fructicola Nara gc5]KAF4889146.1 hypothetical protein CGCFRS4_v009471 [Colletotrichum fructicola]